MKFHVKSTYIPVDNTWIWLAFNYMDDLYLDQTANKFIDKNGQLTRKYLEFVSNSSEEMFKIPEVFNSKRYLIQTIKKYYPDAKIVR